MTTEEYREEGMRLFSGEGCEADPDKAREYFLRAVEDHDAAAAVYLGGMAYDDEKWSEAKEWFTKAFAWYRDAGTPEDVRDTLAFAYYLMGNIFWFNYEEKPAEQEDVLKQFACIYLDEAYRMGNTECRELLGLCYYNGYQTPHGQPDQERALQLWNEGMAEGDKSCMLHVCVHQVEHRIATPETVAMLEALVGDEEDPYPDACAVLYEYYCYMGDDDKAVYWSERGLEMGSDLMQTLLDEEKEQEVGEDSWTAPMESGERRVESGERRERLPHPDNSQLSTLNSQLSTPSGFVIVVDVDGCFSVVKADASDWDSLPPIVGAERLDTMRCNKFREVSRTLGLKGTLLGLLDRDAFRKPDLEPNWHASQWYDGMADLCGDMIVCLEDNGYNPFSFADEAEARRVADALR